MSAEGIRFVTGIEVGADYGSDQLINDFDATVLCCGATRPRDLAIEGRPLSGIYFAMDFLRANTRSLLDGGHQDKSFPSAKDKDVIVIGGGDTGTDCVATALRHGCRSLAQFEILPRPPERRAPDNPWPQWPRIYRLDYGHEEAAALFGRDPRSHSIMTRRFLGDERGCVRAVQSVELELTGEANEPRPVPGTEREWPAQMVLLALGFQGVEREGLLSQLGVSINDRGNVSVAHNKMTNLPGVFAAGDIERGQSLVVWAIAEGRLAAKGVDKYLMGETELP
jgi:glutamate synthase (NADPH/NADH) small chain